jgi:hypothetical protein
MPMGEGFDARDGGDGVAVLMRYTLRLLTAQLDRHGKAADPYLTLVGYFNAVLLEDVGHADVDSIAERMLRIVGEPLTVDGI